MSAEPVKLTPEQVTRLRETLIVEAYREAVVECSREQVLWYREGWPDLLDHFDRVHAELGVPVPEPQKGV